MNWWFIFVIFYFLAALISFWPTTKAMRKKFKLEEAEFSFAECKHFSSDEREKLQQHYSRLQGTLVFWKNNAAKYGLLHYYCVFWITVGGITTPVLVQAISASDPIVGKWSVTLVALHVAIVSAVHKGFKVEQNYKNFRLGESDYFDLRRRLLDQPELIEETSDKQIKQYFSDVEVMRRDMRNREIDSIASFEEVKAVVQGLAGRLGDPTQPGSRSK